MSELRWSEEQQAVFAAVEDPSGGSLVLEAVAGAGKTTTLVEAVRRMTGSVFLGAYNKKMGDELKSRVAGLPGVVAGTFHSAGFGALRRASSARLRTDERKVRTIAQELTHGTQYADGWVPAICALVSLAKQAGFYCPQAGLPSRPTMGTWKELIDHYDVMERLPEDATPCELAGLARDALLRSSEDRETIDFDDMIYLPLLRELRLFQNDWVLIDEAQDTNATRRALAVRMLRRGGRMVAVGDPHQAIYGFSGADSDSLDLIRRQFGARTLRLSVTYRCPKIVVAEARAYVGHIHPAPTAPDGTHQEMDYAEMMMFAEPGDAVLCRYNRYLADVAFALIRAGKPAKIEGRAIGEGLAALAGRWKVRTLDALLGRLESYEERERAKAEAKDDEARADRISDQVGTMRVLIGRSREQGITTVSGLQEMIRTMFDDVGASPRCVVLSSVHRSKGLEWDRVFVLGRRALMPSPRVTRDWQRGQEVNLCYVAVTRARSVLVDVLLPPDGSREPRQAAPSVSAPAEEAAA